MSELATSTRFPLDYAATLPDSDGQCQPWWPFSLREGLEKAPAEEWVPSDAIELCTRCKATPVQGAEPTWHKEVADVAAEDKADVELQQAHPRL